MSKIYEIKKIIYNHFNGKCIIDLAEFKDYKF